jgi:hypothetical protein
MSTEINRRIARLENAIKTDADDEVSPRETVLFLMKIYHERILRQPLTKDEIREQREQIQWEGGDGAIIDRVYKKYVLGSGPDYSGSATVTK